VDAATAALVGAGVGALGGGGFGLATAWATNRLQRATAKEARWEERRANAYVQATTLLYSALDLFIDLTDAGSAINDPTTDVNVTLPDDQLAALDRELFSTRAAIDVLGSKAVRARYDEAVAAATVFIDEIEPDLPVRTQPGSASKLRLAAFDEQFASLRELMFAEMAP
jgi:hypothetical protein